MNQTLGNAIVFILSNIPFITLVLAFVIGFIVISTKPRNRSKTRNVNAFLGLVLFFAVGVAGIWGFIMHAFYPTLTAEFIGWHTSPFQYEVALSNLGFGVLGIIAAFSNIGFRIATTIFTTIFLWGAAIGHIHQMLLKNNFNPGNAGFIFYTDWLIPLVLIILISIYLHRSNKVFG